jgi:uncharacterized protein (TIGR04255 family)
MKSFMNIATGRSVDIAIRVPKVELGHLPAAPLKLAIAQVRFGTVFGIEEPVKMAHFQEGLGDRYVARETPPPDPLMAPVTTPTWLFRDSERQWTVSLTKGSLGLDANTYLDFDDFVSEFSRILKCMEEIFAPRLETRLGVRYVNHVEDERIEKRGIDYFISPELAAPVGSALGKDLVQSQCELLFRQGEAFVAIRHGLVAATTYVLDFDHYTEGERDFSSKTIVSRVKRFHSLIENLFVWSISGRYLKELKGGRRAS